MLRVAIVGNIASGKSTVEEILKEQGYPVYDTDKIAHEILANSGEIKNIFGTVDRKVIAGVVFSEPEKLKVLESIIHPQVKEQILKIFENHSDIIFVSVPQLFEAGFENLFDKIIYVSANKEIRKERLIKRNSISPQEAQLRINAQSEVGKKEKCDFIIENNSSKVELVQKVSNVLSVLVG